MAKIIIYNDILEMMINHTLIDPIRECGGFLYGVFNNYQAIVNGIYYEQYKGTKDCFIFQPMYQWRAKLYTGNFINLSKGEKLLGTYHSHGIYEAIFSDVDRKLESHYVNGISLIYSPRFNQLVGDIIRNDYIISANVDIVNSEGKYCVNSHDPKIMSTGKAIKTL